MTKLLKIFAFIILLVLIGIGGVAITIRSHLSADALAMELEKSLDVRAQVGDCRASIFARPSRIVVENLVIAPRDEVVETATPHAERTPIPEDKAILTAQSAELEIDFSDLLRWELDIRKIILAGLHGKIEISESGENSMAPLLKTPGRTAKTAPDNEKSQEEDPTGATKAKGLLPIPATLGRAAITSASLTIVNHRQGSRTTLENFNLELTDISIDPSDLKSRNHCRLELSSRLTMANLRSGEPFLDLDIRGSGKAAPLDENDGSFAPSLEADITLARDSSVSSLPFLTTLSSSIDVLSKIGLKLGDLDSRSALQEDASTSIIYENGKLLFIEALDLDLSRFSLGLGEGSWLSLQDLGHEFKGEVAISEELTAEATQGMDTFIRDKVGDTAADIATEKLLTPLTNAAGRITLGFVSSGLLPDPEVGIVTPIPDIGSVMEDIGGSLLKKKGGLEGLLKGLLD